MQLDNGLQTGVLLVVGVCVGVSLMISLLKSIVECGYMFFVVCIKCRRPWEKNNRDATHKRS